MDCCRTSRRLGGEDVKVIVRSGFEEMKACPWEKEDAMHEGIPILNFLNPKEFTHENGKLTGVIVQEDARPSRREGPAQPRTDRRAGRALRVRRRADGRRPGERLPLDRARHRHEFDKWDMPVVDQVTMQSTHPERVLRRRRRVRAEEHHLGRRARPRRRHLDRSASATARTCSVRPPPRVTLMSQKMGIHEWGYDNDISLDLRYKVPLASRRSRCAT